MTLSRLLLPLSIAENLSSAWVAGQVALSSTIFYVTTGKALKSKLPPSIAKRGYIVVGTNPNTSPTAFFQEDNKTPAGCKIDVMNAVATKFDVEVRWQDTGGFDNIILELKSGRYDIVLSNINTTEKRPEQVDFVSYYDASRLGITSHEDANIAPLTSFGAAYGQGVGVGAGITQTGRLEAVNEICTNAGKLLTKTAVFPDYLSDAQAVVSGRVSMFFGPYKGLTHQVSQVKPLTLTGTIHVGDTPIPVAFPKQSGLEEAVQVSLNSLIKDGTYQKILDKWFIGFGAVKESKRDEEIFG